MNKPTHMKSKKKAISEKTSLHMLNKATKDKKQKINTMGQMKDMLNRHK